MYRFCPGCDRWLETSDYTVDQQGETVCPDHRAVHGSVQSDGSGLPISEREFRHQNDWIPDLTDELAAAKRQGLVA